MQCHGSVWCRGIEVWTLCGVHPHECILASRSKGYSIVSAGWRGMEEVDGQGAGRLSGTVLCECVWCMLWYRGWDPICVVDPHVCILASRNGKLSTQVVWALRKVYGQGPGRPSGTVLCEIVVPRN